MNSGCGKREMVEKDWQDIDTIGMSGIKSQGLTINWQVLRRLAHNRLSVVWSQ